MEVPEPTYCPDCRAQKRMAFRNEKTLYKRKCDLCEKKIVSLYSSDKPFPVYCPECYFSDAWDGLSYGQKFDEKIPFFEQFSELLQKVPRLAIMNKQSENSEYCNYSFANKNCYLTFGNHYEEDSVYGRYSTKNKNCMDYLWLYGSELCYECSFSKSCYECVYVHHSENSQNCFFSVELKDCKNCFFCSNLRHKEYCILNKQYSKEEYSLKLKEFNLNNFQGFAKARNFFVTELRAQFPFRALYQVNTENSTGDNLENCKNVQNSFDCTNCEDVAYSQQIDETYSSMDMTCMGYDRGEVCYQTIGCTATSFSMSCDSCWQDHNLLYSNLCFSSNNLLGCISLNHKQYCILNTEYSKEEYSSLLDKIRHQMEQEKSWGEFFPPETSPFGYNETIAQEYFPMTKENVGSKGWNWKDIEKPDFSDVTKKIPASKLPDSITDIPDDILNWAIICEESGKLFKIQKAELEFYQKMNLPIPHYHPDIRHAHRMKLRNPLRLCNRNCMRCQKEIQTTYAPERPEIVYCETCYLAEVY